MSSNPIIAAHGVSKTYHDEEVATTALHPVDVTINQGEFVAIMGPSGSGKSTLLNILGLLIRSSSGTYHFDQQDTANLNDAQLAHLRNTRIGFIFQAFHLLPRTSVLANVAMPLEYSQFSRREHNDRAKQALAKVHMEHRLHHNPSQLSGGEKQRTVIARALVTEPDVLFADEPTGNLDSKTGKTVMDLISNLHQEGLTVILITHETPTAQYANRVIRLKDGLIVSDKKQTENHRAYKK